MLSIHVKNSKQNKQIQHSSGPLELGRGPKREVSRLLIKDAAVSRDQLSLKELPGGLAEVENLSLRNTVIVAGQTSIGIGERRELKLPVLLTVGRSEIKIEQDPQAAAPIPGLIDPSLDV